MIDPPSYTISHRNDNAQEDIVWEWDDIDGRVNMKKVKMRKVDSIDILIICVRLKLIRSGKFNLTDMH